MRFCEPRNDDLIQCYSVTLPNAIYTFSFSPSLVWLRSFAKIVRYNAGPLFFTLGTSGEIWLLVLCAQRHTKWSMLLWIVVVLWPIGFAPLIWQLLKQRAKFMKSLPFDKKKS